MNRSVQEAGRVISPNQTAGKDSGEEQAQAYEKEKERKFALSFLARGFGEQTFYN